MSAKEKKLLTATQLQEQKLTDAMTKEVDAYKMSTKKLSKLWENQMVAYEKTALHNRLLSYQSSLTRQMEFKDKIIEKLQKNIEQIMDHRDRSHGRNLELVDKTLNTFRQEIEEVHNQYQVEITGAIPENLETLEARKKANDLYWRLLKYLSGAVEIVTKKNNSEVKKNHIRNMDLENGRLESTVDKIHWRERIRFKNMMDEYFDVLSNYKYKTEQSMEDFKDLREKDENMLLLEKELNTQIKELTNSISNLEKDMEESKSLREYNMVIKERDELQEILNNFIKKVEHHSKFGVIQILLLCNIFKQIESEMTTSLKKGIEVIKIIHHCQKLETLEERARPIPICGEFDDIQSQNLNPILIIQKLSNCYQRISNVKISAKQIDKDINQLECENKNLKENIRCLINRKKI